MANRVKITLTFSADLDSVPGFVEHWPEDWVLLIKRELNRNSHLYNTDVKIQKVEIDTFGHDQAIDVTRSTLAVVQGAPATLNGRTCWNDVLESFKTDGVR